MAKALAVESNKMDHNDDDLDRQRSALFGERIRARAEEIGKKSAEIARLAGIKKQSMTGYWNGERICGSDKLFPLSDALGVNARWLVDGVGPRIGGAHIVDAEDAAWVNLPRFDLRQLTEAGKGARTDTVPIRRDWLNRRLMVSSGLWITELPSDYDALDLAEGDVVICSDIVAGDGPQEKWVCIFRGQGGPFVARYTNRSPGEIIPAADSLGDVFVTAAELHAGDTFAIARIHARMLAKL